MSATNGENAWFKEVHELTEELPKITGQSIESGLLVLFGSLILKGILLILVRMIKKDG